MRRRTFHRRARTRRRLVAHQRQRMLGSVGLDPRRPLTNRDIATRFVAPGEMAAYLDYVEARGPGRAGDWRSENSTVSPRHAIDRIADLTAREGNQPGVGLSVAAVARAAGSRHVHAAGEVAIERSLDAFLAQPDR